MEPTQQPQPTPTAPTPTETPVVDTLAPVPPKKMSGRTKAALWCLIGPTGLYIVAFFMFAVVNLVLSSTTSGPAQSSTGNLFGDPSLVTSLINILLFMISAVAFLTWLPGIIIGIVLLATKKPA